MRADLFTLLSRRPDQVIGVCAVAVVVLLLLALVLSSPVPLYVAAVPLAILGVTRLLANPGDDE